jgi:catechol 2,3-dioxygenase-like lactoylglutathione lyase family enzyme
MIKNRKSDHIGLATNDIEATVNWYIDVLGFELIGDFVTQDGTQCKFLKNTDVVYEIFQSAKGVSEGAAGKIDHFCFQSENIERDYDFCKELGYQFTTKGIIGIPTFWEHGCRYFKIASPTGEEIEFCEVLK